MNNRYILLNTLQNLMKTPTQTLPSSLFCERNALHLHAGCMCWYIKCSRRMEEKKQSSILIVMFGVDFCLFVPYNKEHG